MISFHNSHKESPAVAAGLFLWGFMFKIKTKTGLIIIGIMLVGAAYGANRSSNLTDDQVMKITEDCRDNPDSFRCR